MIQNNIDFGPLRRGQIKSWGSKLNFNIGVLPPSAIQTGVLDAISNGRGGLGTAIVFAGGNERADGGNTNYNALTNNPAVITVGAINAPGDLGTLQPGVTPFSNPGDSILVSAPGSDVSATGRRLITGNDDVFGADTTDVQGSSFAAPIVSGVIALMLEANPDLGYRDIQEILSITARKFDDPNFPNDWTDNHATGWNGGARHVSGNYGYGIVDAQAAVQMAETWTRTHTAGNVYVFEGDSGVLNNAIADNSTLTQSISMASGMTVEHAQVVVNLDHGNWGDLILELISPTGTVSTLVDRPGVDPGSTTDTGDVGYYMFNVGLGSTHFRGEDSGGAWTLQVTDARTGVTGILKDWQHQLWGSATEANETYYYTNEYAGYGADPARATLVDTDADTQDTIDASAVTVDSLIDLLAGSTSYIAGQALTLGATTAIERAVTGGGNDYIYGNDSSNVLMSGSGNDIVYGFAGIDLIDGGKGNDTLTGGSAQDYFVIWNNPGDQDVITDFTPSQIGEKLLFVGFGEAFSFADIGVTNVAGGIQLSFGVGQTLTLQGVAAANFTEQNTTLLPDKYYYYSYLPYIANSVVSMLISTES